MWSSCLLDLGTDFLVGNMVFVNMIAPCWMNKVLFDLNKVIQICQYKSDARVLSVASSGVQPQDGDCCVHLLHERSAVCSGLPQVQTSGVGVVAATQDDRCHALVGHHSPPACRH